jgi:hypothetical protein
MFATSQQIGGAASSSRANRAVALVLIALFVFDSSRILMAADQPFVCPHHVETQSAAPAGSADHSNHQGHGKTQAANPGAQPGDRDSGLRCCCRHSWDALLTTLLLDTPADAAKTPLPESAWRVPLTAAISFSENDLNPPFQPPRI